MRENSVIELFCMCVVTYFCQLNETFTNDIKTMIKNGVLFHRRILLRQHAAALRRKSKQILEELVCIQSSFVRWSILFLLTLSHFTTLLTIHKL